MYYMRPIHTGWTINNKSIFDITDPNSLKNPNNPNIPSVAEARNRLGIPFDKYDSTFYNKDNTIERPSLEELAEIVAKA